MNNCQLTIAIPTYNRNETLLRNLKHLLPQLNENCLLLIIDNNSEIPVSKTLTAILTSYHGNNIQIIRNDVNVGASANVMRCFELCKTEWLWVLGDDDTVKPDAIKTIFETIDKYPDCAFYSFSSEIYQRNCNFITNGADEFIEKLDSFSNVLFISSGFYNSRKIKSHLQIGYIYGYSLAPHFAALLASLAEDVKCYFSSLQLVSWNAPTGEQQWSFLNTGLRLMTVLELVKKRHLQQTLARKILNGIPPFEAIVAQLVGLSYVNKQTEYSLYLLDHIYFHLFYFNRTITCKFKYIFYKIMLRIPNVSHWALQVIYKQFKNKNFDEIIIVDLFKRI
jgi:glycosyltransferase involved in cell wall biosynthesis